MATLTFRGTFIEVAEAFSESRARASSTPPAQAGRDVSNDLFNGEREYISGLWERAEALRRRLPHKDINTANQGLVGQETPQETPRAKTLTPIVSRNATKKGMRMHKLSSLSTDAGSDGDWCGQSSTDEEDSAAEFTTVDGQPVTTMMLCNLPCRVMQKELEHAVSSMGFAGRYDYLFVPKSHRPGSNLGYAFINLVNPEDAERCRKAFTGYHFPGTCSTKTCSVKPARLQGAAQNLAQFGSGRKGRVLGSR